jgi:hypothetical protein
LARSKKVIEEKESDEILLSKEEVWDVLNFARSLAGAGMGYIYDPMMLNTRMKDVSHTPIAATENDLDKALANPKESEELLRSYIENFEIISMPFKRILSYLASHLSFDIQYTVKNAEAKDYTSNKFKKDQYTVYDYFDRFNHKLEFRNIVKQILRNEIFVGCIREDGENIIIQELPLQFIKITAKWDYGLLASMNFQYFLESGVDVSDYPEFFQKSFNELVESGKLPKHKQHTPPELRGVSNYALWVDLPPEAGWVFKLDTSLVSGIPYFSGLMPLMINDSAMLTLQKDLNLASASKMIWGQVPMLKESKAQVADMLAIKPETLGQFLRIVQGSLSKAVKISSAPLEDLKGIEFEGNDELYDKWIRTVMSNSGMNTSLIYSNQVKANVVDSQLSFQSDSKIMEQQLYPQFEQFLNYWVNKKTSKFKYVFRLEGNDYYLDRKQRLDSAVKLGQELGIVLPQLIASAVGLKPQELYRMMEESKAMKFAEEMVTPIIPGAQRSLDNDPGGRPQKGENELTESGEQTRSTGGNINRG